MALSTKTKMVPQSMDPADEIDIAYLFGELEVGETISTFTVTADTDSATLGFTIGSGARAPAIITGTLEGVTTQGIQIWVSVSSGLQGATIFDTGVTLGAVIKIVTSASPSRTYERTVGITCQNR